MFQTSFRLPFRIFGIPIHFDISFLVILPLLAWVIASNISQYAELFGLPFEASSLETGWTPYWIGLVASLGLFASVLVHECGHSIVGRSFGMRIRRITLWILGGMAQFEGMPRRPGAEALMAVAGPITSLLIGGLCWGALSAIPASYPATYFIFSYLFYMNCILADAKGEIQGMVGLSQLKKALRRKPTQHALRVADIMRADIKEISTQDNAYEAFQTMNRIGSGRVLVKTPDKKPAGLLSRADLLEFVQILRVTSRWTDSEHFSGTLAPHPG